MINNTQKIFDFERLPKDIINWVNFHIGHDEKIQLCLHGAVIVSENVFQTTILTNKKLLSLTTRWSKNDGAFYYDSHELIFLRFIKRITSVDQGNNNSSNNQTIKLYLGFETSMDIIEFEINRKTANEFLKTLDRVLAEI